MSLFINTNIASLYAQNNVANSQTALATSIQRLSSGLRINSAKDDAAGMAIAARMTSQIGGMTQAAQNANDGISLAQTAEGALAQVTNDLQTMRNLAVQAANGTNSASDRSSIQASITQLQADINQISSNTQYNGLNLLDGTLTNVQFQVGANANQTINASIGTSSANSIGNNQVLTVGKIDNAVSGTGTAGTIADIPVNNVTSGTLTVAGNGAAASSALTITAGETAFAIATAVNGASNITGVTATATTTATLNISGIGTSGNSVSLTLVGANNAKVTISATPTSSSDVTSLTAQINAASTSTGITAIAGANGTIQLSQAQGYDIGVLNNNATATTTLTGGNGAGPKTLAAYATAGDAATVGGQVSYNSPGSFTVTDSGTNIVAATATTTASALSAVSTVDVTKLSTAGVPIGANNALAVVDAAINTINGLRANLGALQNRFSNAQSSLTTTSTNMQQARSRIQDTDFAAETANLTHNQILQQAGTAMLAQANALPNSVLTLLK
ncbi:B-type flagellin [mine drainage metagenome]|uniref:B-type flagellin n=1 Tax=mine drainage metagenome TaxID=410659 RepID=A0A1J5T4T1_9ZZZZ